MSNKDLRKQPPRSPRHRINDYVIFARTTDKCRALLAGKIGEYHFDCPVDNMLFSFKGITGNEFKKQVSAGATDEALGQWLDNVGATKSREEVRQWSDKLEQYHPYEDSEKREWFVEVCKPLHLDPTKATLFDYLDKDDELSFEKIEVNK